MYADGLFSLPLNIPGTPYGKAVKARAYIVAEIERESAPLHPLCCPSIPRTPPQDSLLVMSACANIMSVRVQGRDCLHIDVTGMV